MITTKTHPDRRQLSCDVCGAQHSLPEGQEETALKEALAIGWVENISGGTQPTLNHYCPNHAVAYLGHYSGATDEELRQLIAAQDMRASRAALIGRRS